MLPITPPPPSSFNQEGPRLGNQFEEDFFLQALLRRYLGEDEDVLRAAERELRHVGDIVVHEMMPLARLLDTPGHHPRLVQYDAWGNRIDDIETSWIWKQMKVYAAREGIIADGYDLKKWKTARNARLVQYMKLFLYSPSSGLYTCPLAMTDGAAKALKISLRQDAGAEGEEIASMKREFMERLITRDPDRFITSGQFMTEKKGGSDVSNGTETMAFRSSSENERKFKLYGYKWFTSATDGDIALTLGRIDSPTAPLSCFLMRMRDPATKKLNNIRVTRLKNKLGTKQLPTAELSLEGTDAVLLNKSGVRFITSTMVNITRIHNAVGACAGLRRMAALIRDYSHRRVVFHKTLAEHPLHIKTLADIELKYRACMALTMDLCRMFGEEEDKEEAAYAADGSAAPATPGTAAATSINLAFRLLIPVAKGFTAKLSVISMSEGLECFGGQGYIEDTGIPVALRDGQVMSIWEGATNVMSLDVLRVLMGTQGKALVDVTRLIYARCDAVEAIAKKGGIPKDLAMACDEVRSSTTKLLEALTQRYNSDFATLNEELAREFTFTIGRLYSGSLLMEHALATKTDEDCYAAKKWCCDANEPLVSKSLLALNDPLNKANDLEKDFALALCHVNGQPTGYGNLEQVGKKARAAL